MKYISTLLLMILLLALPASAFSGAAAFVDRTNITRNESVQLTIKAEGDNIQVDISPLQTDFKVIPGGTQTSVKIINGNVSKEASSNYSLIPLKEGRLQIPSLIVHSDGSTFRTQPIIIQVNKTPQTETGSNQNVMVDANISETNVYEGQQFIYTFRLLNSVQIANARYQQPDFSGFNAKQIGDQKTFRSVISGIEYHVTKLSYVLVPLKTGAIKIEPAVLQCDIVHRQRRKGGMFDSIFNDPFFGGAKLEPKIFESDAFTVNVTPLPSYDQKDAHFSGLVGKFSVQAELERDTLKTGDSTTLSITMAGTGNIMDAEEPDIKVPEHIKLYKDKPEEDIQTGAAGFSGKKTFRMSLVPVQPGDYKIDPIRLSYFDTETGQYKIIQTASFEITALPSDENETFNMVTAPDLMPGIVKKKVEFKGRDILPLKEELNSVVNRYTISFNVFLLLLLIPALLCLMAQLVMHFIQKPNSPSQIMWERAAKILKEAAKSDSSAEFFLAAIYRALVSAILSKAGIKGESLTYDEARNILTSCGFSAEIVEQAVGLLEKIESAGYSGMTVDEKYRASLLEEAASLIRKLAS